MPQADLALHAFKDAPAVLKARKRWVAVLDMLESGQMPPDKQLQPTAAEQTAFIQGVRAIFEHADNSGEPDPGRVTIRRLNRTEYNNTVRDLLGVDFRSGRRLSGRRRRARLRQHRRRADRLAAADGALPRPRPRRSRNGRFSPIFPQPSRRYLSGRYLAAEQCPDCRKGGFASSIPRRGSRFTRARSPPGRLPEIHGRRRSVLPRDALRRDEGQVAREGRAVHHGQGSARTRPAMTRSTQLPGAALPKLKPLKILKTFEITARDAKKLQTDRSAGESHRPISRGRHRAGEARRRRGAGASCFIEHLWS